MEIKENKLRANRGYVATNELTGKFHLLKVLVYDPQIDYILYDNMDFFSGKLNLSISNKRCYRPSYFDLYREKICSDKKWLLINVL